MKLTQVAKPHGKLEKKEDSAFKTDAFSSIGYYDQNNNYYERVKRNDGVVVWLKLEDKE